MNIANGKQLRVLFIDDEPEILDMYRHALDASPRRPENNQPIQVTCCPSGRAAVDAVKTATHRGEHFAVIFLDVNLGRETDGIIIGEKIREMDPYVNFVVVTGLTDIAPQEITRRIPPADKLLYVQKPFHVREIRQFVSALGAKWRSEMLLRKTNRELKEKVRELEQSQKALMDNQIELESATRQLMETNDALSVLARNLERTRKESEQRIFNRAVMLMMPIVEKLQHAPRFKRFRTDLDLLAGYVNELSSGFVGELAAVHRLSVTEMRIASMIRNGMTSKEIARNLFISAATVKTHRRNIRKKLNLHHSRINLRVYLASEMGSE